MNDEFGNEYTIEIRKKGNIIAKIETYVIPEGKTTLKQAYPKFKEGKECAYPKRQGCNNDISSKRCEYMKFRSLGHWDCTYKKN